MTQRAFSSSALPGPASWLVLLLALSFLAGWFQGQQPASGPEAGDESLRQSYSPLHFQPAIATATDAQCLVCHREVLEEKVKERSPAGIPARDAKAWYQQLGTYQGDQETFHRRHLVTPLARQLMRLSCNTCHQGHDPRDQAPGTSATGQPDQAFPLRRNVDAEAVCLRCHGQMDWRAMGLPAPWPVFRANAPLGCLQCHAAIRTVRHQVNYLQAEAIEAAGKANADACFGCHGGRAWYAMSFSYPRHPWPGMPADTPAWAKSRPTQSEARFLAGTGAP